jgi:biotin synthase
MSLTEFHHIDRDWILSCLREDDPETLSPIFTHADLVRRETVGDEIHLRGLVEISNHCARECLYCGLRHSAGDLVRYRMNGDEIYRCALLAVERGYGTLVMQAGEDDEITGPWLATLIKRIKSDTSLAVTLSLGERSIEDLAVWRESGADRYLLRFETTDRDLYDRIHPPRGDVDSDRFAILSNLRRLGFETGSGIMVGIPGQSYCSVADDLLRFQALDLDMIGIGPYLPHPGTPMGRWGKDRELPGPEQVPASELFVRKCVAITRILSPEANIPRTTALSVIKADDERSALNCGANVIMPNLTPMKYRRLYDVYPAKANVDGAVEAYLLDIEQLVSRLGRTIGTGPGSRNHGK